MCSGRSGSQCALGTDHDRDGIGCRLPGAADFDVLGCRNARTLGHGRGGDFTGARRGVAQAGLQVDRAGFVAATELFAQVAGTGVFLWASPRWTLRTIAVVGLCVMVVGNIATAVSVDFASLMMARAIGGAGGGVIRALCMMSLAKALSPGRAFAVYAGAQVGLAAVTTAFIPHFIEMYGARSPFLVLTLASALGFALCPLLPRGHRGRILRPSVRIDRYRWPASRRR